MLGFSLEEPTAQFADRFLVRSALGVLCVALALASGIGVHFLDAETTLGRSLDWLGKGLGVATLVIVAPPFIALLMRRSRGGGACAADGFIAEVFRRACADAFSAVFLALVATQLLADRLAALVSLEIAVDGVLCVGLLAFSIAFFRRAELGGGMEEDEEETP